ncbi:MULTISPECIES: helicase associated domain-containing protein [unclassified Pseudomonas]|uniref:helicase associated domain-containing protein n=1 Tax=unclassified Pseudomonas TaxID=196821 RepID=UPI002269D3EC
MLSTEIVGRIAGSWPHYFGLLKAFAADRGHARVPRSYRTPAGHTLGAWCYRQRALHRLNRLPPERVAELEAIGFDFDPRARAWEQGFKALQSWKAETGNASPGGDAVGTDGFAVGQWCSEQRRSHRLNRLSRDQIKRLEALGFVFNLLDEAWEKRFRALVTFKDQHGHLRVGQQQVLVDGTDLADWCRYQRTRQLDPDRRSRLEAISFDFGQDLFDSRRQAAYEALQQYSRTHGTTDVPLSLVLADGTALGNWVSLQRLRKGERRLDAHRIKLLDDIGFTWDTYEAAFAQGVAHLEAFKASKGHCDVPVSFVAEDGYKLGQWCARQRTRLKAATESNERRRLVNLGLSMDPLEDSWRVHFEEAAKFVRARGASSIPVKLAATNGLKVGAWWSRQKTLARTGKLEPGKRAQLECLGLKLDA